MPVNKPKKPRPPKTAPAKVNNYLKNKPTIAKSRNVYPAYRKRRDVEEVASADPKLFIPVIEKGKSNGPTKKSNKRSPGNSKK